MKMKDKDQYAAVLLIIIITEPKRPLLTVFLLKNCFIIRVVGEYVVIDWRGILTFAHSAHWIELFDRIYEIVEIVIASKNLQVSAC